MKRVLTKPHNLVLIPYEELDKHFTAPKYWGVKKTKVKLPRKLKKAVKKMPRYQYIELFDFLKLESKLSWLMESTNPNYKRFLIKKICEMP